MRYTFSEKTVKKYTIEDVKNAAKAALNGKSLCVNMLKSYNDESKFTLVEMNSLVDDLVCDSHYWNS